MLYYVFCLLFHPFQVVKFCPDHVFSNAEYFSSKFTKTCAIGKGETKAWAYGVDAVPTDGIYPCCKKGQKIPTRSNSQKIVEENVFQSKSGRQSALTIWIWYKKRICSGTRLWCTGTGPSSSYPISTSFSYLLPYNSHVISQPLLKLTEWQTECKLPLQSQEHF